MASQSPPLCRNFVILPVGRSSKSAYTPNSAMLMMGFACIVPSRFPVFSHFETSLIPLFTTWHFSWLWLCISFHFPSSFRYITGDRRRKSIAEAEKSWPSSRQYDDLPSMNIVVQGQRTNILAWQCHEKGEAVVNRPDCWLLTMLSHVSVMNQDVQMKRRDKNQNYRSKK